MQLGLSVATRSGLGPTEIASLALAAEHAGFDAFFIAERVADSLSLCQSALAATRTITVGTAVANARLRHPALMAMSAATIDEGSGGRFLLGLGSSNVRFNEVVLGLEPVRPVPFMRDYLRNLREALGRDGPADARAGSADALDRDRPVTRASMSILLGALLPRMLQLAGQVADGVILNLTTPTMLPGTLKHVADGAASVGRSLDDLLVACVMPCHVGTDCVAVRRVGQELIVGYAQNPAAAQVFAGSSHLAELQEIEIRLSRKDRNGALSLVSDELIDDFLLHGSPNQCQERIDQYRAAGVNLPILFPIGVGDNWGATIRATIAVASQSFIPQTCVTT